MCDVHILQAMSKRIHYGKFVAEVKFKAQQEKFTTVIQTKDKDAIWELITDAAVEEKVLNRISLKGQTYGRDPSIPKESPDYEERFFVDPKVIRDIYENIIIPMTKDVQVLYLLQRLDHE
jgi:chorismate mutase